MAIFARVIASLAAAWLLASCSTAPAPAPGPAASDEGQRKNAQAIERVQEDLARARTESQRERNSARDQRERIEERLADSEEATRNEMSTLEQRVRRIEAGQREPTPRPVETETPAPPEIVASPTLPNFAAVADPGGQVVGYAQRSAPVRVHRTAQAIERSLGQADAGFNEPPERIAQKDTVLIRFRLNPNPQRSETELLEPIQELVDEQGGRVIEAEVRFYERMRAELTGSAFEIVPILSQTQAVRTTGDTSWEWEVTPRSSGKHQLRLNLYALVSVDDESTPLMIHTYKHTMNVYVTVNGFVSRNWPSLLSALIAILGLPWVVRLARRSRAMKPSTDSP